MTTPARLTLRRALALPLVYAGVFGVFEVVGVPRDLGFVPGLVAATALALILILSPTPRTLAAAVFAILCASILGVPFYDPCTPISPWLGVALGWVAFRIMRRANWP